MRIEQATFGAGCFWSIEEAFRHVDGVVDVAVGYSGGTVPDPTYRMVCSSPTGHAEVVLVEYDVDRVSYDDLLNVFWQIHDPTTLNRQGVDIGTQYRSAIFFHTEAQRAAAEASKKRLDDSGHFRRPIVTEITPAAKFYRAEEYHQRYLEKSGLSEGCAVNGCGSTSVPKTARRH
ncbi:MAG: peptide-methionine (S)-S-oxide reductase MsrA [Candidatus Binataceae bacterium]